MRNSFLFRLGTSVLSAALLSAPVHADQISVARPNTQMKMILDELASKGGRPIESLSPSEARQQPTPADAVRSIMRREGRRVDDSGLARISNRTVQGAVGRIPARIYFPVGHGPLPVIVYFHGGGFVIATNDTYDSSARSLAKLTGAIVISVEYRKGPEFKFPAAHEDAFAAYQWTLAHAASLGGDPRRISVAGESAGGNLAINVSIRARDAHIQMPTHQLLVYPIAGTNFNTRSYRLNANAKPLNKPMMIWFFNHYLNSQAELSDPRLNVLAASLRGLPATTMITDEIDPLRSEGLLLASRLRAEGVQVTSRDYKGVTHEFFGMAPLLAAAREAQVFAAEELKRSF